MSSDKKCTYKKFQASVYLENYLKNATNKLKIATLLNLSQPESSEISQ